MLSYHDGAADPPFGSIATFLQLVAWIALFQDAPNDVGSWYHKNDLPTTPLTFDTGAWNIGASMNHECTSDLSSQLSRHWLRTEPAAYMRSKSRLAQGLSFALPTTTSTVATIELCSRCSKTVFALGKNPQISNCGQVHGTTREASADP